MSNLSGALSHADEGAPEAIALLDTARMIRLEHVDRGRRALAVCAAASGAGVSFVTAGLAVALAQMGVKVLVVDANLRRPALHDLIVPAEPVEGGLLQLLRGEIDEAVAIVPCDAVPHLSLVYAGGAGAGVQELFDSDVFERFLRYCMRTYDLTLVDTPPANRCAEARRIAGVAGYAAIVARRDITLADDLKALVADLETNRVEVIGTILNEG